MLNKFEKIQLYLSLFILAFFVCLYFPQNFFTYKYFPHDTSVYQYIGKLITEGYMPYRDVFDHKGPLVYLYYALGYSVHPMMGVWIFEILLLFLSLAVGYHIVQKYLSPCLYIITAATVLATIPIIDSIGNNESLSFLPVMGSILILKIFIERQKISCLEAVILGVLSAVLLLIKPPLVVANGLFVLYIIGVLLQEKSYRGLCVFLFYGGMGFILPLAIVLGWLGYNHALKDFFDDYILFNLDYMHQYKKLKTYSASFLYYSKEWMSILIGVTSVLLFIRIKVFEAKERTFLSVLAVALLCGLFFVITPCNEHAHYLTAVFPLLLILFSYAVYAIKLPKLLMLLLFLFLAWRVPNIYHDITTYQKNNAIWQEALEKTSSFIRSNYPEDTKIFSALPEHCVIYLYSGRYSPHKYPLAYFAAEIYRDKVTKETLSHPAQIVIENIFGKYQYMYNLNNYHLVFHKAWVLVLEHN